MDLIMDELRSAYLSESKAWIDLRPGTARENNLLLLQGSLRQIHFYEDLGWRVRSLVWSPGLKDEDDRIVYVPVNEKEWPVLGMKFHALIANVSVDAWLGFGDDFWMQLRHLCCDRALVRLFLNNVDYYGNAMLRSGRELFPFPSHQPFRRGAGIHDIRHRLEKSSFVWKSAQEDLDGLFSHQNMEQWSTLDGWDCKFYLPTEPLARKSCFIKSWWLEAQADWTEAQALASDELAVLHQEIESLLEQTALEEAGTILDKLFAMGATDARSYNLQGILFFYRQNPQAAWQSFRMAIEGDRECLDYYRNFWDAACQCGLQAETLGILRSRLDQVPALRTIKEIDWDA